MFVISSRPLCGSVPKSGASGMALDDAWTGLRLRAWTVRHEFRISRQVEMPWQVPTISVRIL